MRTARLLAVVLLVLMPGAALACSAYPQPPLSTIALPVSANGARIVLTVELAQTEEQRNCGLMGRPRLANGTGMLFDMRPAGPAHFWMRNTPQSLDLLFFDSAGRLVYLVQGAMPYSERAVGTNQAVAAVLELAAGQAAQLGIGPGARAHLP